MKFIVFLLITINVTWAEPVEFKFERYFSQEELGRDWLKELHIWGELRADLPEEFKPILKIDLLSTTAKLRLVTGTKIMLGLLMEPEVHFSGEEICDAQITDFYFNFQRVESQRLPGDMKKELLRSLKILDLYDPLNKKPELVARLDHQLQEWLANVCGLLE